MKSERILQVHSSCISTLCEVVQMIFVGKYKLMMSVIIGAKAINKFLIKIEKCVRLFIING